MIKGHRKEIAKLKAEFQLTDDDVKDFKKHCSSLDAFRLCAEGMFTYRWLDDKGKSEMWDRLRAIMREHSH